MSVGFTLVTESRVVWMLCPLVRLPKRSTCKLWLRSTCTFKWRRSSVYSAPTGRQRCGVPRPFLAYTLWDTSARLADLTRHWSSQARFIPRPIYQIRSKPHGVRGSLTRSAGCFWAQSFTERQIQYAATDAWVGYLLHEKISSLLPKSASKDTRNPPSCERSNCWCCRRCLLPSSPHPCRLCHSS